MFWVVWLAVWGRVFNRKWRKLKWLLWVEQWLFELVSTHLWPVVLVFKEREEKMEKKGLLVYLWWRKTNRKKKRDGIGVLGVVDVHW